MDEDEHYADERDALLQRFRDSLGQPMSDRFFDEDDLIEIFDYAGDLNDDYLRMEALMCAARYYPDSEELLERRGIFYSQYSDDARDQFLKHNPQSGNMILELLALRNDNPAPAQAQERLSAMLDRYDKLSDEEVIQFVDACSALACFDWLVESQKRVRKKASYEIVAIYEIGVVASINHNYEVASRMFEELTEKEPFNSHFWVQLAMAYAELDQPEKSLSAIEYSLAIKPDSVQALLTKARLLHAMEHPKDEVENVLASAERMIGNDDVENLRLLATTHAQLGHDEDARLALERAYLAADIDQQLDLIPELLQMYPDSDRADELFDDYFALCEDKSKAMWLAWANQLTIQGFSGLSRRALRCYERNSGETIPSLLSVQEAFAEQRFEDVIRGIKHFVDTVESVSVFDHPAMFAMQLVSLVKLRQFDEARDFCKLCINQIDLALYPTLQLRMQFLSLRTLALVFDDMLKNPKKVNWDDVDPLDYWSDY